MKRPSMQFYPGDWLKDPALAMCSPMARGIWIDALCLMHERESGELSGTIDQLCRALRCNADELTRALDELSVTNAGNVTRNSEIVTLLSRRLARECKCREQWRMRQTRRRESASVTQVSRKCHVVSSSSSSSSRAYAKPRHIVSAGQENPQLPSGSVPPEGASTPRKRFVKPGVEEVAGYMRERGWRDWETLSRKWWDHYEKVGWVCGKARAPMKDWRAAVRTWESGEDVVIERRGSGVECYAAPCGVCGEPGRGEIAADGTRLVALCAKCRGEMERELLA